VEAILAQTEKWGFIFRKNMNSFDVSHFITQECTKMCYIETKETQSRFNLSSVTSLSAVPRTPPLPSRDLMMKRYQRTVAVLQCEQWQCLPVYTLDVTGRV